MADFHGISVYQITMHAHSVKAVQNRSISIASPNATHHWMAQLKKNTSVCIL